MFFPRRATRCVEAVGKKFPPRAVVVRTYVILGSGEYVDVGRNCGADNSCGREKSY